MEKQRKVTLKIILKNKKSKLVALLSLCLAVLGGVCGFYINWILGILIISVILIGLFYIYLLLGRINLESQNFIDNATFKIKQTEQEALLKMPLGILMLNDKDKVFWINPYLQDFFGNIDVLGKKVSDFDNELAQLITDNKEKETTTIMWHKQKFSFLYQKELNVIYLMNIDKYAHIEEKYKQEQLLFGHISIDNYDDIVQGMSDSNVLMIRNFVTRSLSDWADTFNLYLRQVDVDHYLILGYLKDLQNIENDNFNILNKIREATSKQNYPLTISMGISYGEKNISLLSKLAQSNLDLALGRGGDQVVVKAKNEEAHFFGGTTSPMEKRTRVRSRMIANALNDLISQSDQVFIAGHSPLDLDAFGSCLGILHIAKLNKKNGWVLFNDDQRKHLPDVLLNEIQKNNEIYDCLINEKKALDLSNDNSLLILLDHSKISLSIAPNLYEKLKEKTIIIDHHRRGEEFPNNVLLSYIEPYASSTSELVTELLEYQSQDSQKISKLIATSLLSGIELDTKNFVSHTGTRTFDAASYLKLAGANMEMISQMNKQTPTEFIEQNNLINNLEILNNKFALVTGNDNEVYSNIVTSQTANRLLNVSGIVASFVITLREDKKIGISARSNGNLNVQLIMEKMGGGGHLQNAATQVKGKSITEVKDNLINILNEEIINEDK